jgi:hypothetical protein
MALGRYRLIREIPAESGVAWRRSRPDRRGERTHDERFECATRTGRPVTRRGWR